MLSIARLVLSCEFSLLVLTHQPAHANEWTLETCASTHLKPISSGFRQVLRASVCLVSPSQHTSWVCPQGFCQQREVTAESLIVKREQCVFVHAKSLQSCPTLCDPVDCSPPGSSVQGILQARIMGCLAVPFSRASSWSRDWASSPLCLLPWRGIVWH